MMVVVCAAMAYVGYLLDQDSPAPIEWDMQSGKNVKWWVPLGSQTYSNPTIHGDRIFIGSNNGNKYDSRFQNDMGVMLCFEKATGKFLWQHVNAKLATGRSQDWPLQGVTSQAAADGDRLWYLSNRCEIVCLDTDGFYDNENDGAFQGEANADLKSADVVWKVDLIKEFGVHPHNVSHCNVAVDSKRVYAKTSNGVKESHVELASPEAPSFVVLDRKTGKTIWTDNSPGRNIFHGSWGSPRLATIKGKRQILFPGGDGWLYSFEPGGDGQGNPILLWKFDCNPKAAAFRLGGAGQRNTLLTVPTVYQDRVYLTMGQDVEHGTGPSRIWCIEPGHRRGDISPTLVQRSEKSRPPHQIEFRHLDSENGDKEVPNPNSGLVWQYGMVDLGNGKTKSVFGRSLSEVRIKGELAFVTELNGYLHCLDVKDGTLNWRADLLSSVWTSPLISGEHVFTFDEDGDVEIFVAHKDPAVACPGDSPAITLETFNAMSVYSNAAVENGTLYIALRDRLYAIEDPKMPGRLEKLKRAFK